MLTEMRSPRLDNCSFRGMKISRNEALEEIAFYAHIPFVKQAGPKVSRRLAGRHPSSSRSRSINWLHKSAM
jgi:hypothetical protein